MNSLFAKTGGVLLLCAVMVLNACSEVPETDNIQQDVRLSEVQIQNGNPANALKTLSRDLAKYPQNTSVLVGLAQANAALARWNAASELYDHALALHPDLLAAKLGKIKIDLVIAPDRALVALVLLSHENPHDPQVMTDLGVAYDMNGRPEQAQAAYRAAIALDPNLVSAEIDLGLSLALSGQPAAGSQVLAPYARAADASPRARADYALASALNGRPDIARSVLGQDIQEKDITEALASFHKFGEMVNRN